MILSGLSVAGKVFQEYIVYVTLSGPSMDGQSLCGFTHALSSIDEMGDASTYMYMNTLLMISNHGSFTDGRKTFLDCMSHYLWLISG